MAFETKAIVARDVLTNDGWKLEDVTVRKPGPGELLVEMVASGICHSDIVVGMSPKGSHYAQYPRVLGHEGSGYVKEIGPGVTVAKPGDPVLCSFSFCESCHQCKAGITARCNSFSVLNTHSPEQTFASSGKSEPDIAGAFFGQSSFANLSIVKQTSIVNASSLSLSKKELQMLAPLGCGVQTGTGSITNVANAQPDDVACIVGLGGVGLSALLGAKLRGCRTIIGIDRVPSRLDLAKECGATRVINTSEIPEDSSLKAVLQEIADGEGPSITVETTGVPALAETAFDATRKGGKYIQVAIFSDMSYDIKFSLARGNLFANKWFIGAVEGWAHPPSFIPQMIQWWKDGKFPVDKMVKTMKAEEFQKALDGMHDGSIIKPVILWS